MQITEDIVTDREYYARRTAGWQSNGETRWWEIFVVFHGLNETRDLMKDLYENWERNGLTQLQETPV